MSDEMTVDRAVKIYVRIRDAKDALTRKFNEDEAALKAQMAEITAFLTAEAHRTGVDGFKTEHGTVYKKEKLTASCADWDIFLPWVVQHNEIDMLERRIKHATIKQYLADHEGGLPPGVSVFREEEFHVRRA